MDCLVVEIEDFSIAFSCCDDDDVWVGVEGNCSGRISGGFCRKLCMSRWRKWDSGSWGPRKREDDGFMG